MAAGYCFGEVVTLEPARRRWWMARIGAGMTAAFVVIRWINVYGDPVRWSSDVPGMTVLSFFKCTKYPPSLDFLLMTLGPGILLLAWLDGKKLSATGPLLVFGRVPLFYFVVHLFLIHALTAPLAWFRYGKAAFLLSPMPSMGGPAQVYPADFGWDLWVVYAVWIGVVVALYPVCLWFARVKERRRDWWLSYL